MTRLAPPPIRRDGGQVVADAFAAASRAVGRTQLALHVLESAHAEFNAPQYAAASAALPWRHRMAAALALLFDTTLRGAHRAMDNVPAIAGWVDDLEAASADALEPAQRMARLPVVFARRRRAERQAAKPPRTRRGAA